jgi:hypothetical protein
MHYGQHQLPGDAAHAYHAARDWAGAAVGGGAGAGAGAGSGFNPQQLMAGAAQYGGVAAQHASHYAQMGTFCIVSAALCVCPACN